MEEIAENGIVQTFCLLRDCLSLRIIELVLLLGGFCEILAIQDSMLIGSAQIMHPGHSR